MQVSVGSIGELHDACVQVVTGAHTSQVALQAVGSGAVDVAISIVDGDSNRHSAVGSNDLLHSDDKAGIVSHDGLDGLADLDTTVVGELNLGGHVGSQTLEGKLHDDAALQLQTGALVVGALDTDIGAGLDSGGAVSLLGSGQLAVGQVGGAVLVEALGGGTVVQHVHQQGLGLGVLVVQNTHDVAADALGVLVADCLILGRAVTIIGGADGPTSIFLAGKVGNGIGIIEIIIGIVILIIGFVIIWLKK